MIHTSMFAIILIDCAIDSSLRDIKYAARIPVPDGWHLVGVPDQGPTYLSMNHPEYTTDNVYTLKEDQIFGECMHLQLDSLSIVLLLEVCIQADLNSEPQFLKGHCVISRSPSLHPGDGTYSLSCRDFLSDFVEARRVFAIGEPPKDKVCLFRNLKNCIVLPSVGKIVLHKSDQENC